MKTLLALLLVVNVAQAEEMAKEFTHQYTPEVELVLMPDQCDKQDLSQGWIAEARHKDGRTAKGCWNYGKNETVILLLEVRAGEYLDIQIYKDKFEARY